MTHKLEKNTQHTKPCFINLKVNEIKVDEYRLNYLCGSVKFVDHWSAIDVEAGNLLYGAIQYKRGMDWVNKLIEEGADVNYKSHYGQRSLVHLAAEEARIEELNALIAAGANVNAKNERGDTPIMTCAFSYRKFNITIIGMLLDAGANIDLMYREDLTFRQHVERRLKYNPQNSDYRWLNRKIAQIDRDKVSNND